MPFRFRQTTESGAPRPRIGMRLWLGASFAALGLITAGVVYFFVSNSSEQVLSDRATELAIGRTTHLADQVGAAGSDPTDVISGATAAGFTPYFFDTSGTPVAPSNPGPAFDKIPARDTAVSTALQGGRYVQNEPHDQTVVAVPVFGPGGVAGAVLGTYSKSAVLSSAINKLRGDSFRAFAVAVLIAILVGFLVASIVAYRVKRLARGAGEMAAGSLDVPLQVGGRDEIGDLARALDSMRAALRDSFELLSSERDKLSAIFSRLTDAVMVVDVDGAVRFSNPAAEPLIYDGGTVDALIPLVRRAAEGGTAEVPAQRIGERVYAIQARDVPAEEAVLIVLRDRTAQMRRELAEREFVSNAAHELRNPLAGISGAIEVLQAGAKDDPQARDHFLERLAADAERMSRLTKSLLTLARVEAVGSPKEAEIVDVQLAIEGAVAAVEPVEGVEVSVELEPDLTARGDPSLLRQVLVGLLVNAIKNTPPPGTVTLRGRREKDGELMLEVADTGTGIPPDELERVFERFYRGSDSLAQEGFGLGLAIAKRMVDIMGGEIGATSEPGRGSTFWVRLPVAQSTPTPVA
jgi:signal transduction histidine kinase